MTNTEIFRFEPEQGVKEYHVMVHAACPGSLFPEQLEAVMEEYARVRSILKAVPVFERWFLSDAANGADILRESFAKSHDAVARSVVEQPLLDGSKIALWAHLQTEVEHITDLGDGTVEVRRGRFRHLWTGTGVHASGDSREQTYALLTRYAQRLERIGLSLEEHCIRTWFFVRDIDVNYAGVVQGRNEVFQQHGLTTDTHFIASTGIAGRDADPRVSVLMDAYAVGGVRSEDIHYLYAPKFLNRTSEYGVSFERGTYVDYEDRRHIFISGTASINNLGEVVYPGDVQMQVIRMWQNIEALMDEAKASWVDMGMMIVYLRDISDYALVREMHDRRFPNIPKVYLWAPVCRPGWLVEMECMGVKRMPDER